MAENLEYKLKVTEDNLAKALEQNEKKAKSLDAAIGSALGNFAAEAAIKGISLLSDGFGSLVNFVEDSVKAAAEAETSQRELQVALAQTGQLTDENVKSFQEFATQLQATTKFEDDQIATSAALIQQLARLDSDGLKRATTAAADLAATFNLDLESASRLVGKAAEGNTAALQKLGLQFNKGATDAETFSNVLTTLESRFGGNAQAQAKTFSGALTQLSNIYGDLKEEIGGIIVQNPAFIAAFQAAKGVLISIGDSIKSSFGGDTAEGFATFFRFILDGTNAVVLSADAIGRVFTIAADVALIAIRTMALGIVTPIAAVLDLLSSIPKIGDAFKASADVAIAEANRLSVEIGKNIDSISTAGGDTFLSGISQGIAETRSNFDVLFEEIKNKSSDLKNSGALVPDVSDPDLEKKLAERNATILAAESELSTAQQEFEAQKFALGIENDASRRTQELENELAFQLQRNQLILEQELAKNEAILLSDELAAAQKQALAQKQLKDFQAAAKFEIATEKDKQDKKRAFGIAYKKWEDQTQAERVQTVQNTLGQISGLQQSSNKTAAAIGKAAAITSATIDGIRAVQLTLATIPPPFSFAAAAAVGAVAALNVSKIAGVKGFAGGGVIGSTDGATRGQDNKLATVRTGEMILNADQQKNLFDFINNGASSGGEIVVQIDGREVARAVRSQIKGGFRLA